MLNGKMLIIQQFLAVLCTFKSIHEVVQLLQFILDGFYNFNIYIKVQWQKCFIGSNMESSEIVFSRPYQIKTVSVLYLNIVQLF
jgi:hypothetical protein